MDNTPTNKSNLIAGKFWVHTKEIWGTLSIGGRQNWLKKAIELAQNAFADATAGTNLACPLKYSDFAQKVRVDSNLDGTYDEEIVAHSPSVFYGTLTRKCVNTWDAVATKQALQLLVSQYSLRDTGRW